MMIVFWLFVLVISLFILVKAADFFIDASEKVGLILGISPFLIGVSIVALGTSLPELITAIMAMLNNSSEMVIGNVVGSNITIEKSRIDYEMDTPISEYFEKIQAKLDEIVSQDAEVKVYDDPEKPGWRWWEVLEWKMPCGGTHVKRTGEIGKVRLKRKNTGAGKERIEIMLDEN